MLYMKDQIGGLLAPEPLDSVDNGLLTTLVGEKDDVRHMMSGRCGILLAIEDWMQTDDKRVAYLPAYTCETVSGCFVKAGYEIYYYDIDQQLRPQYDDAMLEKVSLVLVCGYYGFVTFDEKWIQRCEERGIAVILDATHSVFSQGGASRSARYLAASFRKWMSIPAGGIAIKRDGQFLLDPIAVEPKHIALRNQCMEMADQAVRQQDMEAWEKANDLFWDAEMYLRDVFDIQESDAASVEIVSHIDVEHLRSARMRNYDALQEYWPGIEGVRPVFDKRPDGCCPSHFPVYAKDPADLQTKLREHGIRASIFWPVPPFIEIDQYPQAKWIYEHILSLPCDQRYGEEQMKCIAETLRELSTG